MKDATSTHQKIQELCDCYATTDPLAEMAAIPSDSADPQAGEKWLALAALHGINSNARKITLQRGENGQVTVVAEYRDAQLPSPQQAVADRVLAAGKDLTHMEGDKVKLPLALGIRDSSVQLQVKIKRHRNGERLSLKFP
jgi:hypothetical protein